MTIVSIFYYESYKDSISARNRSVIASHFCLVSGSTLLLLANFLPSLRLRRALEKIPEAHRDIEKGGKTGNIVITVP